MLMKTTIVFRLILALIPMIRKKQFGTILHPDTKVRVLLKRPMVKRIMTSLPKEIHILILGICEYVPLHDKKKKKDFADMVKLMTLRGRFSWVI